MIVVVVIVINSLPCSLGKMVGNNIWSWESLAREMLHAAYP